jgi:hypothetical protein
VKFLCGCDVEAKQASYRTVRTDDAGNPICPEHGSHVYGFASPQITGPAGNRVPDWKAMSTSGKFIPVMEPESVARQIALRDLDRQAQEHLAERRSVGNGQ